MLLKTNRDKKYINLAINLAKDRIGLTGTNPSVGCVIVKNNRIISIGQTGFGGTPHAEVNAINNASETVKDSTLYVSLEPCSHYGKTKPCTNKIINSKSGLGLGTFIGKTLLERMKAKIEFGNDGELKGACVKIKWQTKNLLNI